MRSLFLFEVYTLSGNRPAQSTKALNLFKVAEFRENVEQAEKIRKAKIARGEAVSSDDEDWD